MEEKRLQDIIKNNEYNSQKQILQLLGIFDSEGIVFVAEDQFPNDMYVDFSVVKHLKVYCLIETKGSNLSVTDFVRGLGQISSYAHFIKFNISLKNYDLKDAKVFYILPEDVILSQQFNISYYAYPDNCVIVGYNEYNECFRIVPQSEIKKIGNRDKKTLATICSYYVRDTRIFEIYIGLKYCQIMKLYGRLKVDRNDAEMYLRQLNVPDNRNWRNVFISLSSLGLIDSDNLPTETGSKYANLSYEEFAYEVYTSYINKYFSEIITAIKSVKQRKPYYSLDDLKENIDTRHGGKEVLFLTDANKRYLSSWLNIMRDDYGCIDFEPRKSERKIDIIFDPSLYNKTAFCSYVKERSIAYPYIKKFNDIISENK